MRNASIVVKDKKYFIMPEIFNSFSGTTPVEIIISGNFDDDLDPELIGSNIITCLDLGSSYEKVDGWEKAKALDKKLKTLGYKNYQDLRRSAKFLYIETINNRVVFYYTKRHGSRSPSFEGIGEIYAESSSAKDIGLAFKKAINLCS